VEQHAFPSDAESYHLPAAAKKSSTTKRNAAPLAAAANR
jgi:hypothetical protein